MTGYFAAAALLGFFIAHVVLAASLVRRAWWKALLALAVVPLAVYWAWGEGVRWRVWAWAGMLAAYATTVWVATA